MNARINHKLVWILAVVYFLIYWAWYSKFIFGEIWLNQHAKTATDIEPTHNVGAYIFAFVASIGINYALAWLITNLNIRRAAAGLVVGLLCWFAFVFMEYATISVFSAFETNPWPLICIDMGRPLLGFAISGFVLGYWRQR